MSYEANDGFITVVSGLPRTGTSMMMRMLEAGGMPVVVDHDRRPDLDNPNGYYEFEPIKKLKEDRSWMPGAVGRAVKAVYLLLYDLPTEFRYRIIFMRRDLHEVLASQDTMLSRSGRNMPQTDPKILMRHLEVHLRQIDAWLQRQPNISTLNVAYTDAVRSPLETAEKVSRFLGGTLNAAAMAQTVDAGLYRQRKDKVGANR
jgi:hypothetical protein